MPAWREPGRDVAAETAQMVESRDWSGATPAHLVVLHAECEASLYKVKLVLPLAERARAELAAKKCIAEFGGNLAQAAGFVRWAWHQQAQKERWCRANGKHAPRRLTWRVLFSSDVANDFRVTAAREGVELPMSDDGVDLDARPTIVVDADEKRVADEALAALASSTGERVYARAGQLVRVVIDHKGTKALVRREGTPQIAPLTAPALRERLSECASFVRDNRPVGPPDFVVRALLDRGQWPSLPTLHAIVDAPVLRADGTVVDRAGYDEATELLVMPSCAIEPVAESPTRADAERARDDLLEVICDFPYEGPCHRAAAMAAILTPFARFAFDGPTPLFAFDKNVRGAGGSLHADVVGILASGRPIPRMVAAKNAEEERKRIGAIVLAGDPLVLIDNVAGPLGTDALDAALTGTVFRDRLLGTQTLLSAPLIAVWFATGNNIDYGADTLRRVCPIRIASPEERPEEREGFRHPDLLAWVRGERPRLVRAALTLLRAYFVAKRPDMGLRPWGSYEGWSAIVRNAVVWVGLDDPAKGRLEMTATADTERNAIADTLAAWRALFGDAGSTVAAALRRCDGDGEADPKVERMRAALAELCPAPPGKLPTNRAVGAKLRHARRRNVGGLAFDLRPDNSKDGATWVAKVLVAGDSGDSGDSVSSSLGIRDRSSPVGEEARTQSPESPESPPDGPERFVGPKRPMRKRSQA